MLDVGYMDVDQFFEFERGVMCFFNDGYCSS